MSSTMNSGIQTTADGSSYIPSSRRADGSTRKEIKVRPGYKPPEDVQTYKNRSTEAWKNRGSGGVPGVEPAEDLKEGTEAKSKNAKRREAARRKQATETEAALGDAVSGNQIASLTQIARLPVTTQSDKTSQVVDSTADDADVEVERQKKIRNQLKKLRAVRDLKLKKSTGEKLSHDQLMKIGKEDELLRDLRKLDYDGSEIEELGEETTINHRSNKS